MSELRDRAHLAINLSLRGLSLERFVEREKIPSACAARVGPLRRHGRLAVLAKPAPAGPDHLSRDPVLSVQPCGMF